MNLLMELLLENGQLVGLSLNEIVTGENEQVLELFVGESINRNG